MTQYFVVKQTHIKLKLNKRSDKKVLFIKYSVMIILYLLNVR